MRVSSAACRVLDRIAAAARWLRSRLGGPDGHCSSRAIGARARSWTESSATATPVCVVARGTCCARVRGQGPGEIVIRSAPPLESACRRAAARAGVRRHGARPGARDCGRPLHAQSRAVVGCRPRVRGSVRARPLGLRTQARADSSGSHPNLRLSPSRSVRRARNGVSLIRSRRIVFEACTGDRPARRRLSRHNVGRAASSLANVGLLFLLRALPPTADVRARSRT